MDERVERLAREIEGRCGNKRPFLVAIDGPSAGGKSTLGQALAQRIGAALVHMDDFFLPPELRTPARYAAPGGNVHYERVLEEVLQPAARGEEITYGVFDCGCMAVGETRQVPVNDVLLVEGAYSLHPELRGYFDLKVFLEVDEATQKARILHRNGPEKLKLFETRWIPLEKAYFDACRVRECCDLVV